VADRLTPTKPRRIIKMMIDPDSVPRAAADIEERHRSPEDIAKIQNLERAMRFAVPFDPESLQEEARESSTLEGLDQVNSTKIREFIAAASPAVLEEISYYCMEDPRIWEIYWEVIYESAVDIQARVEERQAAK